MEIASAIVQLFPTELEGTYYVPSVRNVQAQGKLYGVYTKFKLKLREVGLIQARKKILPAGKQTNPCQYAKVLSQTISILFLTSTSVGLIIFLYNKLFFVFSRLSTDGIRPVIGK